MNKLCDLLKEKVLERMDFSKEATEEEVRSLIAEEISKCAAKEKLSIKQRVYLEKRVFHALRGLDVLQELLEDEFVTEIMVNGPKQIFYEKNGRIEKYGSSFSSEERLQDVIQQIVGRHDRVVNRMNPIVDTRLEDGSRVNIVLPPIAIDGSAISIRKFPKEALTMERLVEMETVTQEASDVLKAVVMAGYNLFISGGTSSGKTTFLNALSEFIPSGERVITIEDSAELQLQGCWNVVRLETRNSYMEGVNGINQRDLIKTALRMRPERIIVGEVRGGEALDMLQAMNTGHDGSLSTGHANSTKDMLSRLETMVLMAMELPLIAVRQQIASGIDILIHVERQRDKSRKVMEIVELTGMENGEICRNIIFQRKDGILVKTGTLLSQEKLKRLEIKENITLDI